jgi:hypothetical protein
LFIVAIRERNVVEQYGVSLLVASFQTAFIFALIFKRIQGKALRNGKFK